MSLSPGNTRFFCLLAKGSNGKCMQRPPHVDTPPDRLALGAGIVFVSLKSQVGAL